VFQLLYKRLPDKSRLFECALSAYAASENFNDSTWKVEHLLSIFANLTSDQTDRVVGAYRTNGQNRRSWKGTDQLQRLLEQWTGRKWRAKSNELVPID